MYINKKLLEGAIVELDDGSMVIPVDVMNGLPKNTAQITYSSVEYNDNRYVPDDNGEMKHLLTGSTTIPDNLATAMVRSGDYTFDEAGRICGIACERCLNVLYDKYEHNDGYPEGSDEWKQAGTVCKFCENTEEALGITPQPVQEKTDTEATQ